jgi:hypothetical protein
MMGGPYFRNETYIIISDHTADLWWEDHTLGMKLI